MMNRKILFSTLLAAFVCTFSLTAQRVDILDESLLTQESFNRFTGVSVTGFQNWYFNASYGACVSGFYNNSNYENEDWFVSPELDLSTVKDVKLSFYHTRGNAGVMNVGLAEGWYKVFATANYTGDVATTEWIEIQGVEHATSAWNFVSSGELDIPAAAQSAATRIAFRYLCDNTQSASWEVKDVKVWGSLLLSNDEEFFKITTWNTEWLGCATPGLGPDDEDLQAYNIASAIRLMNSDIVALQEITQNSNFPSINTLVSFLGDDWGGNIVTSSTTDCSQNQGIIYKKSKVRLLSSSLLSNGSAAQGGDYYYNWSNGRYPALYNVNLLIGNSAVPVSLVNIHAKSSSDDDSYLRRKGAAEALKILLDGSDYNTKNVIIIGDFNDYLVVDNPFYRESPYKNFIDDVTNYQGITKNIYNTIDHIIISNELFDKYLTNNAFQETDLAQNIYDFYYTTSDHTPVSAWFKFSDTTGIDNIVYPNIENSVQIYPNPVKDYLQIKSENKIDRVELYTLTGNLLLFENNFSEKIPVSGLSQGIYLLKIYTDKGLFVSKIVKK